MAPEGVDPALSSNAHRHRERAELPQVPRTMSESAGALTISANDAEHILARLRRAGLPVVTLNVGDENPLYRVLHRRGRVCAAEGCTTILRRSNPADS